MDGFCRNLVIRRYKIDNIGEINVSVIIYNILILEFF